ncbi:MAG: 50S ribosomal protein L5 [Akkermansiaceae bacterium]|nr:50S ribosomal protein L5 [Akkermansiaceae bacterium]NNM28099.1 50S ribosomal protein L5 [Akkermansiaceae bacterium]
MTPNLLAHYKDKAIPALRDQLGLKNVNEVPKIEKIVVTSHIGHFQTERKAAADDASDEISKITGQKPSIVFAKKSVANFKVREGEPVGARVTLRGTRMWEFLDRFIHITAPNIRDFRGFPVKSFDGRGNYAVGIADHSIFPEIELDKIKRAIGFDIIIVTSARTDEHGRKLLELMDFPFRKPQTEESQQPAAANA